MRSFNSPANVHRTWMKPQAPPLTKLKFIEPLYARLVNELPQGQEWLYEVKFDGYRCLAGRDSSGVTHWSRRANLFTKQFPRIAQASERLPRENPFRREIIDLDESGRVSFKLLQHHRSKAQALVFYAFDVLIYRGRCVLKVPLNFRREVLRSASLMVADIFPTSLLLTR
jgi:bifunctional non-homologous end joining protein LigD